jgi:nucleoid-associated protein YgaU
MTTQIYITKKGDTLRSIAHDFYGNRNLWPLIYNANQETIGPDPNLLTAGLSLIIPSNEGGSFSRPYTVKSGDNLSDIALKFYRDSNRWPEIYDANKQIIGDDPDIIQPGMRLSIPGPFIIYIVKSGDTLPSLAEMFYGDRDKSSDLYDVNRDVIGDDPNVLRIGIELVIPEPLPRIGGIPQLYTVQPGDTLAGIAQMFYGDSSRWVEIYNKNIQIIGDNPNIIFVGVTLMIP